MIIFSPPGDSIAWMDGVDECAGLEVYLCVGLSRAPHLGGSYDTDLTRHGVDPVLKYDMASCRKNGSFCKGKNE
jgi:hypothetical protein